MTTRLPGRPFFSVHTGTFSPVDWEDIQEGIQETKPKWGSINLVRGCRSFVYSCNFTNKGDPYTTTIRDNTYKAKIIPFVVAVLPKRSYFIKKFRLSPTGWSVHTGKLSNTEISVTWPARLLV